MVAPTHFFNADTEDKAGYNQAGKITEILAMLRATFISEMMSEKFNSSLSCCRGVLNIIAGKIGQEIINQTDQMIYDIEKKIPMAEEIYKNEVNGNIYFRNSTLRVEVKRDLEKLWRHLEKIQDEYGYGMFSEDDSGL